MARPFTFDETAMKKSCLLTLLWCCLACCASLAQAQSGFAHFVRAEGHLLKDGDKTLRFISFNVPTLNYQEDDLAFRQVNPYRLPDEYEMRDVFASVKAMGGQVIRIYTLPVRNLGFPPQAPTYVEGPGQFNEAAFAVTDLMLALANEYGIRIIFPLVNNRQWMGGRPCLLYTSPSPRDH
jgi:mannan endo-1,4-beta-mannosidase